MANFFGRKIDQKFFKFFRQFFGTNFTHFLGKIFKFWGWKNSNGSKMGGPRLFSVKGRGTFWETLSNWRRGFGRYPLRAHRRSQIFWENFSSFSFFFLGGYKKCFCTLGEKTRFCVLNTQKPCVTEVFVSRGRVFLKISVVRGSNIWGVFGCFWVF